MVTCQRFKHETPWDTFQTSLEEYPEIQNHVNNFQVSICESTAHPHAPRHFKDSIVVFKKKKLPVKSLLLNIYNHDRTNLELDAHNENKARSSCLRCRKFKKKCTRDLPECLNCESCEEICIYVSRKRKGSTTSISLSADLEKRDSASSTPTGGRSRNQSVVTIDTKLPLDGIKRRLSMPTKLGQDSSYANGRSGSTSSTSDLYRLLN